MSSDNDKKNNRREDFDARIHDPNYFNLNYDSVAANEEEQIRSHCDFIKQFVETYQKYDVKHLTGATLEELKNARELMGKFALTSQECQNLIPNFKTNFTKMDKMNDQWDKSENTDESSDVGSSPPASPKADKTSVNHSDPSGISALSRLLQGIDLRRVPEIEPFENDGEETLSEYIKRFETYCHHNIKGEKSFWLGELKGKLPAETLKIMQTICSKKDSYEVVKAKLVDYDKGSAKNGKKAKKAEFKEMTYETGEEVYLYSMRLEKAFTMAYKDDPLTSLKLINKFVQSAPKAFSRMVEPELLQNKAKKITTYWATIKDYAKVYDITMSENETATGAPKHTINLAAGKSSDHIKIEPNKQELQQQTPWMNNGRTFTRSNKFDQSYGTNRFNQNYGSYQEPTYGNNNSNRGFNNNVSQGSQNSGYRGRNYNNNRGRTMDNHRGRGFNSDRGGNYTSRGNQGFGNRRGRGNTLRNQASRGFRPMPAPGRIVTCNMCGKVGHMDRDCMANRQCFGCGEYGHLRYNCPQETGASQQTEGPDLSETHTHERPSNY